MTEILVCIILAIASFCFGGCAAYWIFVAGKNRSNDRLIEAYMEATSVMEEALENPERSKEILESYFQRSNKS